MKQTRTSKWITYFLIYAFSLMQISPAFANAPVGSSSGGSEGAGSNQGSNTGGSGGSTTDPIDTKSGNCYFTETDLAFNTPGVPLVLSRKYNSNETYDSPVGSGWSHSMDWRLHQAREVISQIVPPVTNENFKVEMWDGTELWCDGVSLQVSPDVDENGVTNGFVEVIQTNVVMVVPEFTYGAPVKDAVDAYVSQPGGDYSVALDVGVPGFLGDAIALETVSRVMNSAGTTLSNVIVAYEPNDWLEVYTGDGASVRFWDTATNGVYVADDKNWSVTSTNNLWTLHLPGGIERVFGADGIMTRYQDGWGRGVDFNYNADGELISAEHDSGLTLQFSYAGGHVSSVSAGSGASLAYTYTTNGLLDTVTQQYGSEQRIRHYEYTDGIMTQRVNPVGHEYNFGYELDAAGNLTEKATALSIGPEEWNGHEVQYLSETLTDVMYTTRGAEQWHRYGYNSKNGKLAKHFGPGTDVVDAETRGIRYGYNEKDDEIRKTIFDDKTGVALYTFTDYDRHHNPTNIAVAYGTTNTVPVPVSTTTWDQEFMLPSSIMNAAGETKKMTYINGSLVKVREFYTETNNYRTVYGYTTDGLLSSMTNANKNVTHYTYDSRGYPETLIPAVGPRSETVFNDFGVLVRSEILPENGTNGTGRVTQYDINPLGWLDSVIYADGLSVSNAYNKLGDLTNAVDRAGRVIEFTYTPESYIASKIQYLEAGGSNIPVRIAYDFDQQFNTLSITEPRGRYVESYQLDIQDRISSVTNIDGQAMSFGYAVGSRVTRVTRFDGSQVASDYDSAGRPSSIAYYLTGESEASATVSKDYYADSQLKTIIDGTTSVSNSYDRLNRLTNAVAQVSGFEFQVSSSYDPVGNVVSSDISIGSQQSPIANAYTYDAAERLTGISTTEGTEIRSFDYSYSPVNGRVSSITNLESGIVTSYAYDIMDRVTNISYTASDDSVIRSLDYQYDALGMITNKTIVDEASSLVSASYEYDSINRLISESSGGESTEYFYDLAGNRTQTVDATPSSHSTNTYTLGVGNRLDSWGANGAAQYDVAGNTTNLVSDDGTALALQWDERYRLISVTSATSAVEYTYDVLGRRISRTVAGDPGSANVEHYVYNGNQIIADLDSAGNILRSYTWGPGIDNLLSMTVHSSTETNTYYALKDHQNTVLALTDASGHIAESYSYDAYGQLLDIQDGTGSSIGTQQSAVGNRYLFQGREHDFTTGFTYFRARWYSPETGRWLSKDPIGIYGGLNLYAFCGNNPVNFVDPLGLMGNIKAAAKGAASATSTGGVVANGEAAITGGSVLIPLAAEQALETELLDEMLKSAKDRDLDKIKDLEEKMADLKELTKKTAKCSE